MNNKQAILYVGIEANSLDVFKSQYNGHFQFFEALTAKDGQSILKEQAVTIVIVEQGLPDEAGTILLAKIKEKYAQVKRILVLDSAKEKDEKLIEELGVFWTLIKPLDYYLMSQVLKCVITILQNEQTIKISNETLVSLRNEEENFSGPFNLRCVANLEGYFMDINPDFCKLLGYTKQELLKIPFREFVHPDDVEKTDHELRSLAAGDDSIEFVNRYRTKSGHYVWLSWYCKAPLKTKYMYATACDVSKLMNANNKVRSLKDQYQSLFDYSPEAIYIHDLKKITHVNQAFLDMFGYQCRDDIVGKPAVEQIVFADDYDKVNINRKKSLEDGNVFFTRIRNIKQDGTVFNCEAHISKVLIDGKNHIQVISREITDKLQLQHELRQSEEKFRDIFNSLIDIFIRVNSKGLIEMISPSIKMLGYKESEVLGKPILNFYVNKEDRIAYIDEIKAKGICRDFETQFYTKQGEVMDISSHGKFYKDNEGNRGVESVLIDITAFKKQQRKLEDSELKLRKFFEMAPVGIAINNMQGNFIEANPEFSRFTGYSETELKALTYWELTPEKYAQDEKKLLQELERHNTYGPYEKEYIHKDGYLYPVLLNGVKIKDQYGKEFIWSIVQDITQRKQNERELFETQKKNAELWHVVNKTSLVSITDTKGRIKFANERFFEVTGYSKKEIIGQYHSVNSSGHHSKEFWKSMWRTILNGEVWRSEIKNKTKSGDFYWVDTVITPIKNKNGDLKEFLSFRYLITDRKQLELSNAELLESLKEYAFQTSHELRAPLANMLGLSQLMLNQQYSEGELLDIFKMMHHSSVAMDSVIKKMNQALEDANKKDDFLGLME